MPTINGTWLVSGSVAAILLAVVALAGEEEVPSASPSAASPSAANPPASVEEARGRARLLHETVHATLQIVHQEFYRENERLPLPAASLRRVFRELQVRQQVELRWLAVNADAMNVDHRPRTPFETSAVTALAAGKGEFELVEGGIYRRAAPITLGSECLRCHAPTRTSNQDRLAALIISQRLSSP